MLIVGEENHARRIGVETLDFREKRLCPPGSADLSPRTGAANGGGFLVNASILLDDVGVGRGRQMGVTRVDRKVLFSLGRDQGDGKSFVCRLA